MRPSSLELPAEGTLHTKALEKIVFVVYFDGHQSFLATDYFTEMTDKGLLLLLDLRGSSVNAVGC